MEVLNIQMAYGRYPFEAEQCDLNALAKEWSVDSVQCVVLDDDSIRGDGIRKPLRRLLGYSISSRVMQGYSTLSSK